MKKRKGLIAAFSALVISTLSLSVVTFAWIDYHKEIQTVQVASDSLTLSNLTTTVYKYVYPYFTDTSIYNYFGTGTVNSYVISASQPSVAMNVFDPTYITISHTSGYTNQSYVSEMNSTLVFKISFSLAYATALNLSFSASQSASYSAASGHYRSSRYLYFFGLSEATFQAQGAGENPDNAQIFSHVKTYVESQTLTSDVNYLSSLTSTSSSLPFYSSSLVSTRPTSKTTGTFTFYAAIDYYNPNCGLFYDTSHLGNTYALDMDYTLLLAVSEALNG